jgi:UPF0716 protein FxsA
MELYILIEAGRIIGLGATIGLIMLTGAAGAWLARSQGVEILRKIQEETARGQMPAITLIEGLEYSFQGVRIHARSRIGN